MYLPRTGVESRSVPTRRSVPSDSSSDQGGDGGQRGPGHIEAPGRYHGCQPATPTTGNIINNQ